ncbi:MAG TPA: hypothetical protein VGZ47_07255 [Gemmataceae bacterium]|jgi:hypothetical protein|nr:hypothetical protein [Gemmataceae bacterium]
MTMTFRYTKYPVVHPIWPLHGRSDRPQPVVTITALGPKAARAFPALVDPGADDTVFANQTAQIIGIDLTTAPSGSSFGSSIGVPVRYAEITLRLTDGIEQREWPARVAFAQVPLRRAVLGFAGVLQFFYSLFDGEREELELTINANYPGKRVSSRYASRKYALQGWLAKHYLLEQQRVAARLPENGLQGCPGGVAMQ